MKCPLCKGSGWDEIIKMECYYCHGTGKIEQTNNEWRQTCSDEEFADWIADVCAWGIEEHRCYGSTDKSTILFWKNWLKEVHHEENPM